MQNYLRTNMMSLFFSGCSITWGDELKDRVNERYSTLVSKHYGCKHVNIAQCGVSNDYIVRNTIKYLEKINPDIVVIQFTVNQRIEYFNENAKIEQWTPQTIQSKKIRNYYTQIYNDILGVENLWKNVFLFDAYCKSVGQKYVSIIGDHYEYTLRRPEKFWENKIGYWKDMCKDFTPAFLHMDLLGDLTTHPHHYANGSKGGHPTAEAHKIIADYFIKLIDAI